MHHVVVRILFDGDLEAVHGRGEDAEADGRRGCVCFVLFRIVSMIFMYQYCIYMFESTNIAISTHVRIQSRWQTPVFVSTALHSQG